MVKDLKNAASKEAGRPVAEVLEEVDRVVEAVELVHAGHGQHVPGQPT